ncbi:type II toxin-antitoxin system prevent-host-death family antitoxin [Gloeocapsopsis sp. IPPAS B-1203]|uniref:type II toxin-antitoxin system Phd/YefM family antitoxin n=1 Tax=Gloeocapsopsis sp. IPPAS B-1203 TaxID=2049454 RepID=UPI000C17F49A|nr:type II toxin-antitoxin system prevent-host-death family antitoxin [Gloeocapsopsis sp. IPPAS B-1203]PIG90589.1 type II toxin-antitoxin system prevent-host-death family antitoxin [Gloeocapsopsis sp. IPPAS B-1203]
MRQVSMVEVAENLTQWIDLAIQGEEVLILKDGQPIVKLMAVEPIKRRPQFGSAKGLITIADDFNEPLEEMREYME